MGVRAKRIRIGKDGPADLAEDTGTSGVNIMAVTNVSKHIVWVGEGIEDGYELRPGQSLPGAVMLGSGDHLGLYTEAKEAAVDVILGFA